MVYHIISSSDIVLLTNILYRNIVERIMIWTRIYAFLFSNIGTRML